MDSWIKLHRSILDWEWFCEPNTFRLFIYFLLNANYEDKKWRGVDVKKGELISSLRTISKETGISIQSVRTALSNMKSTRDITQIPHKDYTHISINNYEKYQGSTQELTHNQHRANTPLYIKEDKNISNINITSANAETPIEEPLKKNIHVDQVIVAFTETIGFSPTDRKPRYEAHNLVRRLQSFIKEQRGEVTPERTTNAITVYFAWVKTQDWAEGVQKLETIRLKTPIFFSHILDEKRRKG